jgi:hypothetical protein
MRGPLAACTLAVVLSPLALAAGGESTTYVAGSHLAVPSDVGIVCGGRDPAAGGACFLQPSDPASYTITVADFLGNPVGFYWVGQMKGELETACGTSGTGFGSAAVSMPEPCTHVAVFPDLGSLAGTITVS